jgi:hypothetical protein
MKAAFVVLLVFLGSAGPALAAPDCLTTIRSAVRYARTHYKDPEIVPQKCWTLGPLTLGMSRKMVEAALGPPDMSATSQNTWQGKTVAVPMVSYIYRDGSGAALQSPRHADQSFRLELAYDHDQLVALSEDAEGNGPSCGALDRDGTKPERVGISSYKFYGVRPGRKIGQLSATFGKPLMINRGFDHLMYWPIPLDFSGEDEIMEIRFASSEAYESLDIPDRCAAHH